MTELLVAVLCLFFGFAIYLATLSARHADRPAEFLDAGLAIPPWGMIFAATGVTLAAVNLHDHLLLIRAYGLQYSHVATGLVLVAAAAALVQKRTWLAARILGLRTLGELLGEYYGSTALRIFLLAVLFLFAVPVAGYALGEAGALLAGATQGAVTAMAAAWAIGFSLFLFSVIGGWRAVVYVVAAQSFFVVVLLGFTGVFAGASFGSLAFLTDGIPTAEGILKDSIPGVIQFTAGIGKEAAHGGIWTTVAILSFAVALVGVVVSPGLSFLAITTSTRKGFAVWQVWVLAGLLTGALLLLGPVLAAELASAAATTPFAGFIDRLAAVDGLASLGFVFLLLASLQIAVVFFAGSGAPIVTLELVGRFVLPGLDGHGQRLASRITLAAIYLAVALSATFAPLGTAILASLALSLSVQLVPAVLGLCWVPWISRSGVLAGLVLGILLVLFTEPMGLIAFEGPFLDLPWGRWPLSIHSAGWGLVFNGAACLLVSLFTRGGEERDRRQRLHDEFAALVPMQGGSRALRSARASIVFLWAFLALGPGAILGNTFFSHPVFSEGEVSLGLPSLLAWQILFWLAGVLIVWWLAYPGRMSVVGAVPRRTVVLGEAVSYLQRPPRPAWISRLLERLTERHSPR